MHPLPTAHPKTVLFMTHGGLMGTTEALVFGVPMIGIPLFADQLPNIEQYRLLGIAERLDHTDLTEENVLAAIRKLTATDRSGQGGQGLSRGSVLCVARNCRLTAWLRAWLSAGTTSAPRRLQRATRTGPVARRTKRPGGSTTWCGTAAHPTCARSGPTCPFTSTYCWTWPSSC